MIYLKSIETQVVCFLIVFKENFLLCANGILKGALCLARSKVKWNLVIPLISVNYPFADKDMMMILLTSQLGIVFYYWEQISVVPAECEQEEIITKWLIGTW